MRAALTLPRSAWCHRNFLPRRPGPPFCVASARYCVGDVATTGSEFVDPEKVAPGFSVQLAPDVELRERTELPDAKAYRGRDEVKEFWRKTQEVFAEVRWEPQEFIDLGTP